MSKSNAPCLSQDGHNFATIYPQGLVWKLFGNCDSSLQNGFRTTSLGYVVAKLWTPYDKLDLLDSDKM